MRDVAVVGFAQRQISRLVEDGNMAGAVNEFMSWTLTNKALAKLLQSEQAPTGLVKLARDVLAAIRRMLGLPLNAPVTSFLEATLGQFHALSLASDTSPDPTGMALFQSLAGPSDDGHAAHVKAVFESFQHLMGLVPARTSTWSPPTFCRTVSWA